MGLLVKGEYIMKRFTLRLDYYTYEKFKMMAKFFNISLNELIIELSQLGYLIKEKEILKGESGNEI